MPAGVGWGQYIKFVSCAMLSMFAGAQVVHLYYRPLADMDVYVKRELELHEHEIHKRPPI